MQYLLKPPLPQRFFFCDCRPFNQRTGPPKSSEQLSNNWQKHFFSISCTHSYARTKLSSKPKSTKTDNITHITINTQKKNNKKQQTKSPKFKTLHFFFYSITIFTQKHKSVSQNLLIFVIFLTQSYFPSNHLLNILSQYFPFKYPLNFSSKIFHHIILYHKYHINFLPSITI